MVTSASGVAALAAAARRAGADLATARWAAVGTATAAALGRAGATALFVPAPATADALGAGLPVVPGERVLVVRGDRSDAAVAERLRQRGADVDDVVAYRTIEGPPTALGEARAIVASGPDGFVFTSGSTVRGLLALLSVDGRDGARRLPAWCIGPSTAAVARDAGFVTVHEAPSGDLEALADLVAASRPASGPTLEPVG